MEWFRFWNQTLNCLKVQQLPGETFKAWSNLLCLASIRDDHGKLPDVGEIAFALRLTEAKVRGHVRELVKAGLVDEDQATGELAIHDWQDWQPPGDDAAARMRRHRARKSGATSNGDVAQPLRNTLRNTSRNCSVPEAEAEAEAEKTQKQKPPYPPRGRAPLPAENDPPEEECPEYPDPLTSMHIIMTGEHPMDEAKAREFWGHIWRAFRRKKLCYQFYEHQQWLTPDEWAYAIKTAEERGDRPHSIRYLEKIGYDMEAGLARQAKPVKRAEVGNVPYKPGPSPGVYYHVARSIHDDAPRPTGESLSIALEAARRAKQA